MSFEDQLEELELARTETKVEPINIKFELNEIGKKVGQILAIDEKLELSKFLTEELNQKTPNWFWSSPKIEKNKKSEVTGVSIQHGYNHTKMGVTLEKMK